jgi:hypothetical protein
MLADAAQQEHHARSIDATAVAVTCLGDLRIAPPPEIGTPAKYFYDIASVLPLELYYLLCNLVGENLLDQKNPHAIEGIILGFYSKGAWLGKSIYCL